MTTRRVGMAGVLLFATTLACTRPKPPPPKPVASTATTAAATVASIATTRPSSAATTSSAPEPGTPTACTASPPVTLRPHMPRASAPISVALTSDAVWVLHMREAGDIAAPVLLEVRNFDAATPRLVEHKLSAGRVESSSALAVAQNGIIGTYVGDKGVVFFSFSKAATSPKLFTVPAGGVTSGGSLAVLGPRALTVFGAEDGRAYSAWFDVATGAQQAAFERIGDKVQLASVVGAFGGVTIFSDSWEPNSPGGLRARGASGEPFALPAVGGDNGSSAAGSGFGDRGYVIYDVTRARSPGSLFPMSTMKIATLTDGSGNGTTVELGDAVIPESSIQAASWGAMGVFVDRDNGLTVAAVDRRGQLAVAPMQITSDGEHCAVPAVAVAGLRAVAVWEKKGEIGTSDELRMSVLRCK